MEEVKTFQKGRAQYYKDIVKDPRGLKVPTADGGTRTIPRRLNPYMVGPAPDSKGFETEADAERIRNMIVEHRVLISCKHLNGLRKVI